MLIAADCKADVLNALARVNELLNLEDVRRKLADPEEGKGYNRQRLDVMEQEYRRFLALHLAHPGADIVPCGIVDEMWHQHILDTRAYREDCEAIFGRFLDHYPYFGMNGPVDAEALDEAYADTLTRYQTAFGEPPARHLDLAGRGKMPYCLQADEVPLMERDAVDDLAERWYDLAEQFGASDPYNRIKSALRSLLPAEVDIAAAALVDDLPAIVAAAPDAFVVLRVDEIGPSAERRPLNDAVTLRVQERLDAEVAGMKLGKVQAWELRWQNGDRVEFLAPVRRDHFGPGPDPAEVFARDLARRLGWTLGN